MTRSFAYLARGQLHLVDESGKPRIVDSHYGQRIREKAAQMAQKNAWKTQGSGAQFMGGMRMPMWGVQGRDPSAIPILVTAITKAADGGIFYSLETPDVAGVFRAATSGGGPDDEKRIYHGADNRIRSLAAHPLAPVLACSVPNPKAMSANIALLGIEDPQLTVVTEGDAIDSNPAWIPGEARQLVFESAGIGRDASGAFVELAPSVIQRLDVKTGEMQTVAEEKDHDLCRPKVSADGALYYVKRPRFRPASRSFGHFLLDILLLPYRLLLAIFMWLNFFSVRYTGKLLDNSGGARQRQADMRRMMMWGNLLQAQQAVTQAQNDELKTELRAPSSWELVRVSKDGQRQTIAKAVATFDVCADGSVLFSDGVELNLWQPDGTVSKLAKDSDVQQVLALG